MPRFVDRQRELRELNSLLERDGAQFVTVYGRRRVGKTTLLLHWVRQANRPYVYWVARRDTADASRQDLARRLDEEAQRHIAENLSEEELAVFMSSPAPTCT